ncbi:MAG: phosphatase PAP2 family protein [Candidatus Acidiferrales bacterium]
MIGAGAIVSRPRSATRMVVNGDHHFMRRMNRWRPPRWFRRWMITATRAGDGWLWLAVAVVVLVAGGPQRFDAILVAGSAAMSGIVVFWVLKRTARRARPCAIERHCWADLLPPDQFSFPSGHSITAFCVRGPARALLSGVRRLAGVLRREYRRLPRGAGLALAQRRGRRLHPRRRPWLLVLCPSCPRITSLHVSIAP